MAELNAAAPAPDPRRRLAWILAVTAACIGLLWLPGFGFGREDTLARWLGVELFGSGVYLGVWVTFMLMTPVGLGLPWLVIRSVFGERAADYGLRLGDTRAGAVAILAMTPAYVLLPLVTAAVGTEHYYTYLAQAEFARPLHVALHCASYAAMMFGFEFLFRGFVLFGTHRALGGGRRGRWAAVALSAALSGVFLIGVPPLFVLAFVGLAIPGGLLTLRTGSIFYFAFINWSLGVWSDVWEIIGLHAGPGG